MRLKAYLENLGVKVCLLSMDNFFLPLAERPKDLTDWESPLCVNRQLLLGTIEKLSNGETVQVPWYDFPNNRTGGYTPMEGSREAIIIAGANGYLSLAKSDHKRGGITFEAAKAKNFQTDTEDDGSIDSPAI